MTTTPPPATVAELTRTEMQTQLIRAQTLSDEMKWILGRPNFACAQLAGHLRCRGREIAYKAEDEQAAVLHWMLCACMQHGEKFRDFLLADLDAIRAKKEIEKDGTNAEP